MRVLGIDPGSRRCGWGVAEHGPQSRMVHVDHGVIHSGDGPLAERLARVHDGIAAVIAQHRPARVAVEGVFHAVNARSALILGHARGAALVAVARAGLPVNEYPPATIKQAATGSGRAEKEQVARMVGALLGVRGAIPADATDALAAALCCLMREPAPGPRR